MSKPFTTVSAPSRKELIALRLMILIGICSTVYLLYNLVGRAQIGFAPFYWILMPAIAFNCLRLLHEWYHYFSIAVIEPPKETKHFTVDIFTTFCPGEPYEMVVQTLEAIQKIRYPHTTYLCDEANDPYLKEVCQRLNIHHITRNDRKDAKAGNINNALKYATGDLCVVLDPDHVPLPEFLDPIVPHFSNPEIGFVQIVQAYSNLGATFIAKGAAQQTFQFYGPIMMTMNSYGTVLAIGANCTFRRAALDSIGGHAAGLAEDMHTAMQLHGKGWKSVYVPAVLARGLVPSNLSAYYAQQLKWSRGTFELFFTTFFRLFWNFTWQQKLHYATIPLYYFSGFITLVNFLIPILSLCTGLIPFRVDMLEFLLLGLPMIASTVLIRLSVQKWVMEEKERGFHVVGGLLQIGTWWIYITSFIYTIIRKKVPYIPTPKDDSAPLSWRLNIPNLTVILISLAAIVYGLSYDWNPYSIVMAGIAGVNCIILTTVILISIRSRSGRLRDRYITVKKGVNLALSLKRRFWLLRHSIIYSGIRKLGLLLLTLTVLAAWYLLKIDAKPPSVDINNTAATPSFYTGIYEPGEIEGLTSLAEIKKYQQQFQTRFDIISLYIPWGEEDRCMLPENLVRNIYASGAIPMITWEPWTSLFQSDHKNKLHQKERKVFARIANGEFDHYIERFSKQIKELNRPLFLRFAHEPDNPLYPWSAKGDNTAEEYIAAWRYVYNFFLLNGTDNVIWVWNPWKAEAASRYFPGKTYVDWLSITALDYGPLIENKSYSFADLYKPFKLQYLFNSGLPVMIGEMGTLADSLNQARWFADAFDSIRHSFPEIKAIVFFNNPKDVNIPRGMNTALINWQWKNPDSILHKVKQYAPMDSSRITASWSSITNAMVKERSAPPVSFPAGILGTNYHTGQNWFRNFHELNRVKIASDFRQMQSLGINTIRRYGPGVYDHNILAVARETQMNIIYSFWMPDISGKPEDEEILQKTMKLILKRIQELKKHSSIIAWSIGNTNQKTPEERQSKIISIYKRRKILEWIDQLSAQVKTIDPSRPLSMDVDLDLHMNASLSALHAQLPNIDAFGIVIGKDTTGIANIMDITKPVYISAVSADNMLLQGNKKALSVFLQEWQDQQTRDYVTFDGVIDQWGRRKPGFYKMQHLYGNATETTVLPAVKILRPARTVFPRSRLEYRVLVKDGNDWRFPSETERDIQFEWRLIEENGNGDAVYMTNLGTGPVIHLSIPDNPAYYRLYVQAVKGADVSGTQSRLNLPLMKK